MAVAGDGRGTSRPALRLLGSPTLVAAQAESPLPAERRTRLLVYLACRAGWVSRNELLALFWPDRHPDSARNNLRYVLLKARELIGAGAMEVRGEALRWPVHTDLADFEAAVSKGDSRGAVALYRGPLLAGFERDAPPPFVDWLTFERARFAALWREAAHRLFADPAVDPGVGTSFASELLRDDPLDQAAVLALMKAQLALDAPSLALHAYRQYAERLADELGLEPDAALRDLAHAVRANAGGGPAGAVPAPRDAPHAGPQNLVGRRSELAQIERLLADDECRLLTLTGPGGIGKSLLARAAQGRLGRLFPDGVWWVALDDVREFAQAVVRCADAAGAVLETGRDAVASLARRLHDHQALLILDNCEHLAQLADLAGTLVRECPGIKLLVTSRARLGCSGEWLLPLEGLAVPDVGESDPAVLRAFDAVKLFEQRARAARFDFDLTRDAAAVNELARWVEGMPLALELAAAWVRLLPVHEIVRELHQSLELLDEPATGPRRERGVRAGFAHSWSLLVPAEQRALAALSVFPGSFSRAAAATVAGAALAVLAALADKSLVRAGEDGRFSLHPLLRQCAAERLAADEQLAANVRAGHARYFGQYMAQFENFHAIDQAAALHAIGAELPNVLQAWEWSLQKNEARLLARCAPGLGSYFQMRGPVQEGLILLERAERMIDAAPPGDADVQWILPLERASLHHSLAQYPRVEEAARKALRAARRARHGFGIRTCLNTVAIALMRQGRAADGDRYLGEALKRARQARAVDEIPYYAGNLGTVKFALGDHENAARMAQEALAGYRANRQQIGMMQSLGELAVNCLARGRTREAIDWFQQGLQVVTDAGLNNRRCHFLCGLAQASLDVNELDAAQRYADRAAIAFDTSPEPSQEPNLRRTLAEVALATGNTALAAGHLRLAVTAARVGGSPAQVVPIARAFASWLGLRGESQPALLWTCWADQQATRTPFSPAVRRALEQIRARHSSAEVEVAEDAARAMTLAGAVDAMSVRLAQPA